jgi:hypothetical protein
VCAGLRYASEGGALVLHPYTELGRQIEAFEGVSKSPVPNRGTRIFLPTPEMRKLNYGVAALAV